MTERTPTGNTLTDRAEQVKKQLTEATDLNKLFKNNDFLAKLKKLPQTEQLKIFEEYKDKFTEISQNPGSAVAKWAGHLTGNLPNMGTAQKALNNGLEQGTQIIHDFRNSLEQMGRNLPK